MTTKIVVALVVAVALAAALVVTGRESVKAFEVFEINLDPATDQNPIGADHTVTATIVDDLPGYLPPPGILVTFTVISGPNAGAVGTCSVNPDCTTDATSQVSFTYTGAGGLGTDQIRACFTDTSGNLSCSDPVTKDWVPLPVDIDIKPGKVPNSIKLNVPRSKGLITVAILGGTAAPFDVTDVDVSTLAFGPGGAGAVHPAGADDHLKDVNSDVYIDLVSHYLTTATNIAPGETTACLTGNLNDGTPIQGCDSIRTIPS